MRSEKGDGLVRRGGRVGCAYPVGPEGCDAPGSPEPAASWFGGGWLGECYALSGVGSFSGCTRGVAPVYHIAPL